MTSQSTLLVPDAEKVSSLPLFSPKYIYDWSNHPKLTTSYAQTGKQSASLFKRIQWSPDGTYLLSSQENASLLLFYPNDSLFKDDSDPHASDQDHGEKVASLEPLLKLDEAESIHDFCWYPRMAIQDPSSCAFLTSSRDHPIHLWDICSNKIQCSYIASDHVDQIIAPVSLLFSDDGERIFGGSDGCIYRWDTHRPGLFSDKLLTSSTRKNVNGQKGIISSMALSPSDPFILLSGSFLGSLAVWDQRDPCHLVEYLTLSSKLTGGGTGITQIMFSKTDASIFFTGHRKSDVILVWDLRNLSSPLRSFSRHCGSTNQRIYFDIAPSFFSPLLATGNSYGSIDLLSLSPMDNAYSSVEQIQISQAHDDLVSAVSFHPIYPLLASCSGQRHFDLSVDLEEDEDVSIYDESDMKTQKCQKTIEKTPVKNLFDCSVKIWQLPGQWLDPSDASNDTMR